MIKTAADIVKFFQFSGLVLKFDAAEYLYLQLASLRQQVGQGNRSASADDALVDFLENVKKSPSATSLPLVDRRTCEVVFQENYKQQQIVQSKNSNQRQSVGAVKTSSPSDVNDDFVVISAFDCPRFKFDHERSRYHRLPSRPDPLPEAAADAKIALYLNRYYVLMDRLRRSEVFAATAKSTGSNKTSGLVSNAADNQGANKTSSSSSSAKKFALTTVECLLGSAVDAHNNAKNKDQDDKDGEKLIVVCFGLLTRMKDGQWHLEDPTGFVRLDLSTAQFQSGLLGEHCFVLCEGRYDDDDIVFKVRGLGLPPPETAVASRTTGPCGDVNMFGGLAHQATTVVLNAQAAERSRKHPDDMMVIVSDVWLDMRAVLEKLRLLFAGYADAPPSAFIFCGNFLSTHYGERQSVVFREKFADFYAMLSQFKTLLTSSRFIFVPGGDDPGLADTLPRFPLLKCLLPPALVSNPLVTLASNPCRLAWYNREIVIFRSDLVQKLARHTVNCAVVTEQMPLSRHFARTLVSQAHLCPLPIYVQPVSWPYDHALALQPLPDVVVVADRFSPYHETVANCHVANSGSFVLSNFHFMAYYPYSNELEDCQVVDLPQNNNDTMAAAMLMEDG